MCDLNIIVEPSTSHSISKETESHGLVNDESNLESKHPHSYSNALFNTLDCPWLSWKWYRLQQTCLKSKNCRFHDGELEICLFSDATVEPLTPIDPDLLSVLGFSTICTEILRYPGVPEYSTFNHIKSVELCYLELFISTTLIPFFSEPCLLHVIALIDNALLISFWREDYKASILPRPLSLFDILYMFLDKSN